MLRVHVWDNLEAKIIKSNVLLSFMLDENILSSSVRGDFWGIIGQYPSCLQVQVVTCFSLLNWGVFLKFLSND